MIAVYSIKNIVTGQSYVGSTNNYKNRKKAHLSLLRRGIHHCNWLQHSWNKYGESSFILIPCFNYTDYAEALLVEDEVIQEFYGNGIFNSKSEAIGVVGCHEPKSEQTKEKMSLKAIDGWANEDIRNRRASAMKGKREIVKCPHCKTLGGGGNMKRYHFENCNSKHQEH